MATVLRDVVSNHPAIGSVSLEICMVFSCAVLVIYCVTGGIIASVHTDLIQGLIMVVAVILVFATATHFFSGGVDSIVETIQTDNPEAASPWGTLGIVGSLSWFFLFAVGNVGQPHVVTKLMMSKRITDSRHILWFTVVGYGFWHCCGSVLDWSSTLSPGLETSIAK